MRSSIFGFFMLFLFVSLFAASIGMCSQVSMEPSITPLEFIVQVANVQAPDVANQELNAGLSNTEHVTIFATAPVDSEVSAVALSYRAVADQNNNVDTFSQLSALYSASSSRAGAFYGKTSNMLMGRPAPM